MKIDEMIDVLQKIKAQVGGDAEVPILIYGYGENDYVLPSYGVVCGIEDSDGKHFKCALVGEQTGEELSRIGVPHYEWKPIEDKVQEPMEDKV